MIAMISRKALTVSAEWVQRITELKSVQVPQKDTNEEKLQSAETNVVSTGGQLYHDATIRDILTIRVYVCV